MCWRRRRSRRRSSWSASRCERRPALAAEIAARGHTVALHGYRHRPQPALPGRVVADDLARGAEAIARRHWNRGGMAPTAVRPVQPRRPRGGTATGTAPDPVVAVGQGLAALDHPGADRRPGDTRSTPRRRDPPARCGFLQLAGLARAHRRGLEADRERTQTSENRYRPASLRGWIARPGRRSAPHDRPDWRPARRRAEDDDHCFLAKDRR